MTNMPAMPEAFNPAPDDSIELAKLKEAMRFDYAQLAQPDAVFIITDSEIANAALNIAAAYTPDEDDASEELGNAAVGMILPFLADLPAIGEQEACNNSRRRSAVINLICQPEAPESMARYNKVHKFSSILEVTTRAKPVNLATAEPATLLLNEMVMMPEVVADMPSDALIAGGLLKPVKDKKINERKLEAFKAFGRCATMGERGTLSEMLENQRNDCFENPRTRLNTLEGRQFRRNIVFFDDMIAALEI
jgi:hypothetical protein